ncbi:hypothetical protein [Nonomuraea salmonea]|uniref:hypothetical protein n=1 Tax=Nonomuraea salmonea TaxID=46181 RepID=UPI002FEB1D94
MLAGLLLPALLAAGLWYGVGELSVTAQRELRVSWVALGVLAVSGILLAFLAGSRLSPVASLLGGLAYTGLGVLPFAEISTGTRLLPDALLPSSLQSGFMTLTYSGLQFLLGVALLVVSAFPSRWRGGGSRRWTRTRGSGSRGPPPTCRRPPGDPRTPRARCTANEPARA